LIFLGRLLPWHARARADRAAGGFRIFLHRRDGDDGGEPLSLEAPGAARLALALLARTDKLLGVVLLGNALLNAAAATIASIITVRLLGQGEAALALSTVVVTFLILVFSEITPKVVGAAYADRLAPLVSFVLTPLLRFTQ